MIRILNAIASQATEV